MKQKKVNSVIMVVLLSIIFVTMFKITVLATDVNGVVSSANAVVGENVTLTVTLSSSKEIFGIDVHIQYDASKLDFVSGDSDSTNVNGGNGRIVLYSDTCQSTKITATLVFKAKEAGSHNVYLTADSSVYDTEVEKMNLVASTGVITATSEAPVSADNNLKDLTVYIEDENGNTTNGWYWPAFNKDITQYYLNVEGNAKKLAITANANSGTSTVSLNNPELLVGNNNITVTVKAQDGSTKNYVITVTKAEKTTEKKTDTGEKETTTSAENKPSYDNKINIGDKTYTITDYTEDMAMPEGYEIVDYEYKGSKIKALKGLGTGLVLMALTDSEANIQSFVYNEEADDFFKFVTANIKSAQYVLIDIQSKPENVEIPENYTLTSVNYGDNVIVVYAAKDSKVYIVSAIDCNGIKGLYYLDSENDTIMKYFANTNVIQTDNTVNNSQDSDELYKLKIQNRIILISSVTIILILIGINIACFISLKNSRDEEYEDDEEEYDEAAEEYEKEEEYDEAAEEYEEEEEYDEAAEEYEEEEEYDEAEKEHDNDKEEHEDDETTDEADNNTEERIEAVAEADEIKIEDAGEIPEETAEKINIEAEEDKMSNREKVMELLEDDSTSLREDELDMVLDELLSDIFDGENK